MSLNANEQHGMELIKSKSSTIKALPIDTLRHCLSFLGSSDNYYFLASVCKDFKTVVEQLYRGNRNTSTESIIATVSTCNHVFDLLFGDTDLTKKEREVYIEKVAIKIFVNDRVDIFEGSIIPVRTTAEKEKVMIGNMKMYILSAINHRSTEIMRSIIKNQKNVQFMKVQINTRRNGFSLASHATAACDVHMIKELIDHGVAFNADSLFYALRRDDLDTFKYLVDVVKVQVYDRKEKALIVCDVLGHQKCNDAFEMLMRHGFVCFTDLREVLLYTIASHKPTLDLVKRLLGILVNEIEIDDSDVFFHHLVSACIEAEERRLDILSYISTSIREIDVQSFISFYEDKDDEEAAEFLRGML